MPWVAKIVRGGYWHPRQVDKYLRRPVYTGKMRWGKRSYASLHQPLISEAVFNKVQEIFTNREYRRSNIKIKGILRHILFCGHCQSLMVPNYTRNRHKKEYYYYRFSSQIDPVNKGICDIRNIAMADTERIVLSKLLDLATERQLKIIEAQFEVCNVKTHKEIKSLADDVATLEKQLKTIHIKKERYLDSLIRNQFQNEAREAINAKIEEFTLSEKKLQAQIYAKQFEHTQKQNQIYAVDDLKRELIFLKVNHKSMSESQLEQWLRKNVERITHRQQGVTVRFKNYPVEV